MLFLLALCAALAALRLGRRGPVDLAQPSDAPDRLARKGGGRDADLVRSIVEIARLLEREQREQANRTASRLAERHSVGDLMKLVHSGVPGAARLQPADADVLLDLPDDMAPEELARQAESWQAWGYRTAAIALVLQHYEPIVSSPWKRDWESYADLLEWMALELAENARERRLLSLPQSARNVNDTCFVCHENFRGGIAFQPRGRPSQTPAPVLLAKKIDEEKLRQTIVKMGAHFARDEVADAWQLGRSLAHGVEAKDLMKLLKIGDSQGPGMSQVYEDPLDAVAASLGEAKHLSAGAYRMAAIAEMLYLIPPIQRDDKDVDAWKDSALLMRRHARVLGDALEKKDLDLVRLKAADLHAVCVQCHQAFRAGEPLPRLQVKDAITELKEKLRELPDAPPGARFRFLCRQHKEEAIPLLVAALRDDHPRMRYQLARLLGDLGREAHPAIPGLIALLKDNEPEVRSEAIVALSKIGLKEESIAAFIEVLKDPDVKVRQQAMDILTSKVFPRPETGFRFIDNALKEAGDHPRWWFAYRLHGRNLDLSGVARELGNALKSSDAEIRGLAADLLARMDVEARPALGALRDALGDQNADVRRAAALALRQLGAMPALARALHDPDPIVRGNAAIALARAGKPAVADLIGVLKTGGRDARASALFALGKIGADAREAVPHILELVKCDDAYLRKVAGDALRKVDPDAADKAGVK